MLTAKLQGGDHLNETLQKIAEAIGDHNAVRIGFLEGSTCGRHNNASAPQVAFILEYGAPAASIPPRPFFRTMIRERSSRWPKLIAAMLKLNGLDSKKTLSGVGLVIGEELQHAIEKFPPLNTEAELRTAKRKGFHTPLQDSKNMKRAVEFEVSGGERRKTNESA